MSIPTEPIGSIPRPAELIAAWQDRQAGRLGTETSREIAFQKIRARVEGTSRAADRLARV